MSVQVSDRELLQLAAKAAGISIWKHGKTGGAFINNRAEAWSPLDNDGDALRLAVKLRIEIIYSGGGVRAVARGSDGKIIDICECLDARRAIVMAAAVIWRAMP